MKKYIIHEGIEYNPVENVKRNQDSVVFEAIIQSNVDKPNRNGRLYPRAVLEEALRDPFLQQRMRDRNLYGESAHPMDQSLARQMGYGHHEFLAFFITEVYWRGNDLYAKCETCATDVGRNMMGLIKQGSKVGFSLRAQGSLTEDRRTGVKIVESPLRIFTWDWVVIPSHDASFITQMCNESLEQMFSVSSYGSLNESLEATQSLCEHGNLFLLEDEEKGELVEQDYTKYMGKGLRPLSETYSFEDGDALHEVKGDKVRVYNESTNTVKTIFTEDFALKNIRNAIKNISESKGE